MPMQEQVVDISKVQQDMADEIRSMRETIDWLYAENLKPNRTIGAFNHQIRKKEEENAKLREQLAKYEKPDKNSVNSSTPPCKEKMKDEIARRTRTLRKPSVKKAGGQQGHDGHKLYPSSIPDEVADDAADYCTECGEPSADAERVLDHVTQVISIPELKRWSRKSGTMSWCARTAVNMCVRHRDGVRTTLCTTPA